MAQYDVDPNEGIVDKRKVGRTTNVAGNTANLGTPGNYGSVVALRTRLAAINGAYFTAARLNQMSKNDMVYALRESDDTAGRN